MENDAGADAYAVVLADLRRQRDEIETAIAAIERLTGVKAGAPASPNKAHAERTAPAGGSLLGMSIADAARKVLEAKRNKATTAEIVTALEAGGVELTSADKNNTVGSILLRRFYNVGDIVRVNRGVWGLQEWYPGRKFAKGSKVGEVKEPTVSKEDSSEEEFEQEENDFDMRGLLGEANTPDSQGDDFPF